MSHHYFVKMFINIMVVVGHVQTELSYVYTYSHAGADPGILVREAWIFLKALGLGSP